MKKPIIIIFTFVILSFFLLSRSFAVCIMPPGYNPADDPDINLDLSGWGGIDGLLDQFVFDHPTDPNAPQLSTLIAGLCDLDVTSVNMISGTGRPPAPDIPADYANLICLSTPVGASVLVPNSGYSMGGGCEAVVLYATSHSIVLKYTPDDNIVSGYTVYLNNFQVDSGLLAFYNAHAWDGSGQAPCLAGGMKIGSSTGETCVAIRDTGTYMDPRWQEWWNQCPASALNLILKLIDICMGELPAPGECYEEFPQPDKCCPISGGGGLGWILDIAINIAGSLANFVDWLLATAGVDITFTLYTSPTDILSRSWQLQYDADYFWASNPRYDPRRIALPDEEPEEGMWPGAALRIAPPGYRPSYTWKSHRDKRLKWEIPLDKYSGDKPEEKIKNWWGDSEAFHPLATGSVDLWEWLVKTPATDEMVAAAHSDSSSALPPPSTWDGLRRTGETGNPPNTIPSVSPTPKSAISKDTFGSSQTLGTQSPQATSGSVLAEEAIGVCHDPWLGAPESVCSVMGEREITAANALKLIFDEYIKGGVELFPFFPRIEEIAYRLAGTLTERYRAYREAGVGGVFDIFLPPDIEIPPEEQKFPTFDANAEFHPWLGVDIYWGCPSLAGVIKPYYENCKYRCCRGSDCQDLGCHAKAAKDAVCAACTSDCNYLCCKVDINTGQENCYDRGCTSCPCTKCLLEENCKARNCRVCKQEDCMCCLDGLCAPQLSGVCIPSGHKTDIRLKTGRGYELIDDVGSQTNALNVVQQWLAPPL